MHIRSSIALLAAALVSQAALIPSVGDLIEQARLGGEPHTTNSWSYSNCGMAPESHSDRLSHVLISSSLGLPTDAVQVKSIKLSPDPPQIGKDLTITARGVVTRKIEVFKRCPPAALITYPMHRMALMRM
jgi:hypothetical protein